MLQRRRASVSSRGSQQNDRLLEAFEAAWQEGPPPSIATFLPSLAGKPAAVDPARQELLSELIKIDLEYRWRRPDQRDSSQQPGRNKLPACPRLEDYVERLPELGPVTRLPAELIAEEYRVRQKWGDQPKLADYTDRFPVQGKHLRRLFPQVDRELEGEHATKQPGRKPSSRADNPSAAPPQATRVHCPHCRQSIEAPAELLRHLVCFACGGTFSVESLSAVPGRTAQPPFARLGRYELGELLGTGAFGSVWRAWDAELGREVAVKVPRSGQLLGSADEERFLREARAAARLHHPGIVAVHDVGRDQETLFIVSELVQGMSLAECLRLRRFTFQEAAELVASVAEALDFAHQRGVVHRDVKPSNIMVEMGTGHQPGWNADSAAPIPSITYPSPRLMDFGLALRNANEITMTLDGQVLGTPAYISPEQLRNPHTVDGRSDLYSLGVILYELLTGELPFRGMTSMLLDQVLSEDPRPPRRLNDRIPRDLEVICLKLLAKEPARRYRTAGDAAVDLRRWIGGRPIQARAVGPIRRLWRQVLRKPVVVVTSGVAVTAVVGMLGVPAAVCFVVMVAITIGSLLFALKWGKKAEELTLAMDSARQDQMKTASAVQFAMKQCLRAREERDRAVAAESQTQRRFGLAQGLARAILFELPDLLDGAKNSATVRSFLVQTALDYLGNLAKEVHDDPAMLREVAVAYARIGDMQATADDASQGDPSGALASHRQSMELFATLARTHPSNAQVQRDLVVSLEKIRECERAAGPAIEAGPGIARR